MATAMFVYYAPEINIHKETAVMVSEQVNIVQNIKGKLSRICPQMFYFP